MRNVVVGSFLGFVLAAAFLAACGSGNGPAEPVPISTPSAVKWAVPGSEVTVVTGLDLDADSIWESTASFDNVAEGTRNQYLAFEVYASVSGTSTTARVDVGLLPSLDGANYASEPQWVGTTELRGGNGRRAVVFHARIPPLPFRVALRTPSSGVRVLALSFRPYNEEFQ